MSWRRPIHSSAIAPATPVLRWAQVETKDGAVAIGYDDSGHILRSAPPDRAVDLRAALRRDSGLEPVADEKAPPSVVEAVERALANAPEALLAQAKLTSFQRRVLETTTTIRAGERLTYSELAHRVGSPKAARAVGSALAANPFPVLIPCHRVVRADGSIGNYSCGGSRIKKQLLAAEASA